jgi:hypothetical protein
MIELAHAATHVGKLLLRDPIHFVWRYGLGWKQPDMADEPFTLDALAFGGLVHDVLEHAVNILEANGGGLPARLSRSISVLNSKRNWHEPVRRGTAVIFRAHHAREPRPRRLCGAPIWIAGFWRFAGETQPLHFSPDSKTKLG